MEKFRLIMSQYISCVLTRSAPACAQCVCGGSFPLDQGADQPANLGGGVKLGLTINDHHLASHVIACELNLTSQRRSSVLICFRRLMRPLLLKSEEPVRLIWTSNVSQSRLII